MVREIALPDITLTTSLHAPVPMTDGTDGTASVVQVVQNDEARVLRASGPARHWLCHGRSYGKSYGRSCGVESFT